jgi:hypothetical protein
MDGKLLRELYHRLFPSPSSAVGRRCVYSDALVALIQLYAALTNHSPRWAHDRGNWPLWARAALPAFPSYSQLMRRLASAAVARVVASASDGLRRQLPSGDEVAVDGKPLAVGGFTKDPDARRGRVPGGWAKGYKVHALVDAACGAVDAVAVTPLDAGEATVARGLLDDAAAARGGLAWTTVRADANYDANGLYARAADAGALFVAPRRKPGTGLGHHAQHPDRLRAIRVLEGDDAGGLADHRRRRNAVEQRFAHLTNVPFGLWALPNHVRRLPRVRRWVAAKVLLYHLYLVVTRRDRAAADSAVA